MDHFNFWSDDLNDSNRLWEQTPGENRHTDEAETEEREDENASEDEQESSNAAEPAYPNLDNDPDLPL